MADHHHHHNHQHHHEHDHHSHGHADHMHDDMSVTEKNRAHWDKVASTYNSTHTNNEFGNLINKITSFLLLNINWIGVPFVDPSSNFESQTSLSSTKSVRILDYACGPGTITAALAGYATDYVGIDLSENMVAEFNKRFNDPVSNMNTNSDSASTVEKLNAHAVVGDLLDPKGVPPSLEDDRFFNFDLAVVSGGFHHFENVELATERLVARLKPGGVFMIWDFLSHAPDDITDHPAVHTIVHHGFDEARVRQLFGGAGLEDIDMKLMPEKFQIRGSAWRQGFLARGTKPQS